jgi:hypothetical protein
MAGSNFLFDNQFNFLYSNTMTNDFSNISAESNLKDETTVRSDEFDPTANPAYDGPMGIFEDYGQGHDDGNDDDTAPMTEAERAEERDELEMMREDESMDGDFDSGMASAGLGYDEQYEHNLCDDYSGE